MTYDPLRSKAKVVLFCALAFLFGVGMASGLGWTSTSQAAPVVSERPQISAAAVKPATDLSDAFTNLAEAVTPAVVRIESRRPVRTTRREVPEAFRRFFDQAPQDDTAPPQSEVSGGSGFIVSPDGYILTNNHVVEGANEVTVYFPDRRSFPARIVGNDPFTDVAVLKVDAGEDLPSMAFGNSDNTRVGEWVLAIGNPGFGNSTQLDFTVTAGIISARGRGLSLLNRDLFYDERYGPDLSGFAIEDFIQTDAVINPGNSGGPMVNLHGQVVGINSAIASSTGVYQGYGFAIPINLARRVMEDLVEFGHVKRPRIGVRIEAVFPEDAEVYGLPSVSGVKLGPVDEDGPSRGKLQLEDVIVAIDGEPVGYVAELQAKIAQRRPGDRVELTVYRDRSPIKVEIRLGEAPLNDIPTRVVEVDNAVEERLGINVEPLDAASAAQLGFSDATGVVLARVARGSAAERRNAGARINEKLTRINDRVVMTPADVRAALAAIGAGQIAQLYFESNAGERNVLNVRMPG